MGQLAISLLGPFTVTRHGQPVTRFGTDKTRALLAYLVMEADRAHRRAWLAGLLWPDFPEADARHSLSQALLMLRKALDDQAASPPFLLITRQTLRFNPDSDATLDVTAFQAGLTVCQRVGPAHLTPHAAQQVTQTVAHYQGEFLSDPWQVHSQAFEEWVLLTRVQLHLQAVEMMDCLVQYHIHHGDFAPATAYARRQLDLEPLRETAHRQLMTALARDGRRPEALAQYAACTTLLARELGIAPAPETTALYEQLRAGGRVDEARTQRPGSHPGTGPLTAPPPFVFVGRARELAQLDAALAAALRGQGQLRLVTGDAGSGKTALLREFVRRALAAHTELVLLNGSGNAYTGSGDPYWPFLEMLRQLSAEVPGSPFLAQPQAARLATSRPATRAALTAAAPGLLSWLAAAPETPPPHMSDRITRALLAVAAGRPLVLIVDDAQWADQESRNLLLHLGRRLTGQRLLLVGAARSDALTPNDPADTAARPLMTLYHELRRYLGDIQLDLAQAEGRPFIDALLDSEPNRLGEAFRETLYRRTAGHALFTTELLHALQARGDLVRDARGFWVAGERIAWDALPARVEGVIAARIGRLLPDWQTLLTVASVEGDEFTAAVVAEVLGLSEAEVCRRCSGALARQHNLLVPLGVQPVGETGLARYRFRHLLFQQYCYVQLDAVEQARLHLRVGQTLETLHGERAREIALALARHFELGSDIEKAVAYLLQAGQRATYLAATEEALRLLTHGLALLQQLAQSPERAQQEMELQLALGAVLQARGWNTPERTRAIERAYELCQRVGDPGLLARSLQLLGSSKLARDHPDQVIAIGEQLRSLAHTTQEAQTAIFAHYTLGAGYFFQGALHPARQHLEQAIELYNPRAPISLLLTLADVEVGSRVWLTYTLWALGYADQALVCSQQALTAVRALGHPPSLGLALEFGALITHHFRRDTQALRATLQRRDTLAHHAELGFFQLWDRLFQGWLRVVADHDADGLSQMQQAIREWEASGSKGGHAQQSVLSAEAYLSLDQAEAALTLLDQTLRHVAATGSRFFEAELRRLKGEALRALDQPEEAAACFQRALAVAQAQSARAWELRAVMSLCRLRQAAGRPPSELDAACAQLAEVYTWFTEGFDTPDLQEAAALLVEAEDRSG
jgi:predicted ATPase/DNA-binding SARP family transcriptional activator